MRLYQVTGIAILGKTQFEITSGDSGRNTFFVQSGKNKTSLKQTPL